MTDHGFGGNGGEALLGPPPGREVWERAAASIDSWSAHRASEGLCQVSTEQGEGVSRWLIRVPAEERAAVSVWFHLRQRSLLVDSYLLPAPEENAERVYQWVLAKGSSSGFVSPCIGAEDALYLRALVPVPWVDELVCDQLLGSVYSLSEELFGPLLRLGFAGRFAQREITPDRGPKDGPR